jgi:hypothetical protein
LTQCAPVTLRTFGLAIFAHPVAPLLTAWLAAAREPMLRADEAVAPTDATSTATITHVIPAVRCSCRRTAAS